MKGCRGMMARCLTIVAQSTFVTLEGFDNFHWFFLDKLWLAVVRQVPTVSLHSATDDSGRNVTCPCHNIEHGCNINSFLFQRKRRFKNKNRSFICHNCRQMSSRPYVHGAITYSLQNRNYSFVKNSLTQIIYHVIALHDRLSLRWAERACGCGVKINVL